MQPKNITFPTDAKLLNWAREKLVKLAKQLRLPDLVSQARGTAISIGPNCPSAAASGCRAVAPPLVL